MDTNAHESTGTLWPPPCGRSKRADQIRTAHRAVAATFVSIRPAAAGFVVTFVGRDLRQLRREQASLFFLVQRQTGGRDDAGGDENDQVFLGMLLGVGAKRSADERNVANDGNLILTFLHVFTHQSAFNFSFVGTNQRGRRPEKNKII